ncbi:DUF262 domain-containing protein [Flavonifractor sp. An306]|uniref:DUF262 domain-containing protein n=1 Tax=Flavonifractor sp. An306 TaxID=1965629 RepID=UPI0017495DB5|nr:DUF262 domain-containing protein [Flavonifractor sp. An306]
MCAKRTRTTKTAKSTAEEREAFRRNWELSEARERASRLGEPTYHFQVGDQVRYGGMVNATILEVIDDGQVYLVHGESPNKKELGQSSENYVSWSAVRPLNVGTTEFSKNDDLRLYYSNRSLESLLFSVIAFGVDFEPDYQRGYVWEDCDRESLLDSIFMGADIGRFVLRRRNEEEWDKDKVTYEIVDGKQRILTLLAYFENRFPYRGAFYNDLSPRDQRKFEDLSVSVAEISNLTRADTLRLFLLLNRGGRPVSDAIIQRAQQLLATAHEESRNPEA